MTRYDGLGREIADDAKLEMPIDFTQKQAYDRSIYGDPLFSPPCTEENFIPAWQDGLANPPRWRKRKR